MFAHITTQRQLQRTHVISRNASSRTITYSFEYRSRYRVELYSGTSTSS